MKKNLLITLYIFMAILLNANDNRTYIEIYSACDQITMKDYNQSQDELQTIYKYYGIDAAFSRMDSAILYEINYVFNLESKNAGLLGIYFRGGRLNAASDSHINYSNGTHFETLSADYSVLYGGFGLRKYIASFFIGADACWYFNTSNMEKDTIFYPDGSVYAEVDKTWPTSIVGVNFETGVDMWMNSSWGLAFRGGYRLAKGKITIDWGELYGNEKTDQTVDYSGFFIGAGIMFTVGDGSKKAETDRDGFKQSQDW